MTRSRLTVFAAAILMLSSCTGISPPPPVETADAPPSQAAKVAEASGANTAERDGDGFDEERILREAESTLGEGAEGLAKMIEDIFRERGRPSAYIVGNEGSGAIAVGLRYGAGRLYHAVEGNQEAYWTGPSVGFDVGGDANKVFALVYNLYDTEELYRRYPSVEGKAYLIGGVTANYLQRGDVVIVPIRVGAGWRIGANVGYLKFTKDRSILPF
ncbi:MAG: DUF1134 domain-containing protein [Pacificimonas sp.]|jgi:hypothetical protein|nr:DUF1134 domain-containing protein [Pacificimonas sp.]